MYGNGAATGMEITAVVRRPTLKVLTMSGTVCTVCFVAAAGTSMRVSVVLLPAAAAALTIATATLGCACPFKFASFVFCHSADVCDASLGGVKNSKL